MPIFPGWVRYEEVLVQKEIPRALRFTYDCTRRAYVPPATHFASKIADPNLPPMVMRIRLRADYDIPLPASGSGHPPLSQEACYSYRQWR